MKIPTEYTYRERLAQAEALGMTYRELMAAIQFGEELPCQKQPIRWPEGSPHAGERIVHAWPPGMPRPKAQARPEAARREEAPLRAPDPKTDWPIENHRLQARCAYCGRVRAKAESYGLGLRAPGKGACNVRAFLCPDCLELLPNLLPYYLRSEK